MNAYNTLGNLDLDYTGAVTITENSGTATLTGTTTKNISNGVALFDDIKIDKAGSYSLKVTNGVMSETTTPIEFLDFCETKDTLVVMQYNLLNFPNGLGTAKI